MSRRARPRAQIAAYVADPARFIARGRRRHGARRAATPAWSTGSATAPPSAGAWPSSPATTTSDVPGSYRAVHYDAWVDEHPASDDGRPDRRAHRRRRRSSTARRGPGTAGGETIVAQSRARPRARAELQGAGRAGRFAGRLGARLGADPPRDARREGARHAGGDLDGLGRGLGRLLGRDRRRHRSSPSLRRSPARSACSAILPSFEGTLQQLGVGADGVRTTPLSGEPDLLRGPVARGRPAAADGRRGAPTAASSPWSRVARRLPPARVDEIGQGRVWDGGTARQLGLVDRFGSLDDAIAEAARRARLDPADARPVYLEREPELSPSCSPVSRAATRTAASAARRLRPPGAGGPQAMLERALARRPGAARRPGDPGALPRMPGGRAAAAPARGDRALWARLLALVWRG